VKRHACLTALILCVSATACSVDREGRFEGAAIDGGLVDLMTRDSARDAIVDANRDAAEEDAQILDAAMVDAEILDADIDAGDVDAAVDLDAGVDAGPPDAGATCIPRCSGGTLADCTPTGMTITVTCSLGCIETGGIGACGRIRPSHVPDPTLLFAGTAAVAVTTTSYTINTDTGEIRDGATVLRAAGAAGDVTGIVFRTAVQADMAPELGIFAMRSFRVAAGATVTGIGARALVILSTESVIIDGVIDVGARGNTAGPGGRNGGRDRNGAAGPGGGARGELRGTFGENQSAGGGGGHSGVGGQGGDHDVLVGTDAPGGAGGAVIADGDGAVLYGGGGGGAGANAADGGPGGGGGGVLQITSAASVTVSATGIVRAPGGPGEGGDRSGGGGGAGGTVFLEGTSVAVVGLVVANGGGGGGGDGDIFSGPGDGARGGDATTAASGGSGAGAGSGGTGGAGLTLGGADGGDARGGGGGGGGAAGRLFFAALAASVSIAGTTSPSDPAARVTRVVTIF